MCEIWPPYDSDKFTDQVNSELWCGYQVNCSFLAFSTRLQLIAIRYKVYNHIIMFIQIATGGRL